MLNIIFDVIGFLLSEVVVAASRWIGAWTIRIVTFGQIEPSGGCMALVATLLGMVILLGSLIGGLIVVANGGFA